LALDGDPIVREPKRAHGRELSLPVCDLDEPTGLESVCEGHTHPASEMIVAAPGEAGRRSYASLRLRTHSWRAGEDCETLDDLGHLFVSNAVIPKASLRPDGEYAALQQRLQVGACTLRRNAGNGGKFACRQGSTIDQCRQHGFARRVRQSSRDPRKTGL